MPAKPDKKAKDAKVSLLADLQKLHKKTEKLCIAEKVQSDTSCEINNNNTKDILHNKDNVSESSDAQGKKEVNPLLAAIENAKNSKNSKPRIIKPNLKSVSGEGPPPVQDQLRLKLEARKKLVEETDEGAETEQ